MNARTALALALAALVTLAACSSEPSQPARVTNYGPSPTYAPSAAPYSSGSPDGGSYAAAPPAPAMAGTINWHYSWTDAQAEARATGKLILAVSTKPRCGMCEKFKTKTAPSAAGELNRAAVGYIYDITRPEVREVDQVLRAHLRGADLMPLVGFLTPDLGWVHGFWGARSVEEFRGDIATARRIHPVRTAQVVQPDRVPGPALAAVVNEFGEPEWSLPADVWPQGDRQPIDAITGAPDVLAARDAAARRAAAEREGVVVADADLPPLADLATPLPPPEDGVPALPPPPALEASPAMPATSAPWSAPVAASDASVDGGTDVAAPDAPASSPEVAASLDTPTGTDGPSATGTPADLDGWAREALERARTLIQAGQFTEARTTLTEVNERLPGTPLAREASKGGVALYNAKRIRLASNGEERTRYLSRARRDFGSSMWSVLFDS